MKEITLIKDINNKLWARVKNHKEETKDNLVFTDGVFNFHFNEYSKWKIKAVSYNYGETWENLN